MHSLSPKSDKITRFSYRRELLKSKLKALCVVCNSFSADVLHGILQQLFVPHVGLNQTVEARRVFHQCVKLGNRQDRSYDLKFIHTIITCVQIQHIIQMQHTHTDTQTLPPGLGCYQAVVNRHIHQAPLIASHPQSSTIWYPWKQDSVI